MSVSGIESVGFTPYVAPVATSASGSASASAGAVGGAHRATGPQGPNTDFGDMVLDGLDRLEGAQKQSSALAVQAATGDLASIHDYTIAATQAAVTTQVTVAVRNKAVEAFNEIMRMPV